VFELKVKLRNNGWDKRELAKVKKEKGALQAECTKLRGHLSAAEKNLQVLTAVIFIQIYESPILLEA